jgi:hypothetical protein
MGAAAGPQRVSPRHVGRHATARLVHESEPSSSLRTGLTSGFHLAMREEGEKRGEGGASWHGEVAGPA